ncbi:unnamed protein product [Ranitomeya imitator]|uniref:FXYD domain-containing ion transport regulator n=1 Tax=Ranitomeya imitator TaxID=111125 RepID=A0ABN9LNU9_9NEOB|nr:unnamed protein product [Ranitomeya imitator]
MISYMRNPSINKSVPGLLLFILILPGSPASVTVTSPAAFAAPTLPDSSRPSAEDSGAQRTTLVYPDRSQNSSSDDPTDPPETTETAAGLGKTDMKSNLCNVHVPKWRREPKIFTVTTRIPVEGVEERAARKQTVSVNIYGNENPFVYDYETLRMTGLILAIVMFVLGIITAIMDPNLMDGNLYKLKDSVSGLPLVM